MNTRSRHGQRGQPTLDSQGHWRRPANQVFELRMLRGQDPLQYLMRDIAAFASPVWGRFEQNVHHAQIKVPRQLIEFLAECHTLPDAVPVPADCTATPEGVSSPAAPIVTEAFPPMVTSPPAVTVAGMAGPKKNFFTRTCTVAVWPWWLPVALIR